jgi:hypothetical protein
MGLTLSRRSFRIFSTFGLCCPFACLCIMPLSGIVKVSISLLICSLHDAFLAFLNFFMVYTFTAKAE